MAMGIEAATEYADQLLYERTGRHLSDLQSCIIQQSWQGRTYGQVATAAGYSEGHIKDVASQLWKTLSEALGERITKGNLRSRLVNRLKRTVKSTVKSATPTSLHPLMASSAARVSAAISTPSSAPPSLPFSAALSTPISTPISTQSHHSIDAHPANFIGREQALQSLHHLGAQHRIIVIQGEGGIGKTTLAQQYCQQFDQVLELLMAKEAANITPVESVVEEWLRQHFNEEPGREFGVTLSRLKQHLHSSTREPSLEQQSGQDLPSRCILIDNLEPALDGNGQFITGHRHYVELLRVLSAANAPVVITSRDRLCEPGIKVHHYRLPGLTVESWQQFFEARHIDTQAQAHSDVLSKMHRAYGGNAKAMEILCAAAIGDFEGDLSAYWQENGKDLLGPADLRNLVNSQVDRLQALDTEAYRVFCRLGCFRYQDQPSLRAEVIAAVMWDIPPSKHRQTLNSLRDRSLLEFCKGHYWLHPVSRAEAIDRLRQTSGQQTIDQQNNDWLAANRAAAEYWTRCVSSIVTVDDGLQALEAYYHLIAAGDYDGAAAVLLQSRHNQWRQFLPLASSLYRMGLLQPVINAITQVLPHTQCGSSELSNILGDVYWITGEIHSAIACQQKTLAETAEKTTAYQKESLSNGQTLIPKHSPTGTGDHKDAYYLRMLTVDAHLSIGLYHIDLWELSQAAEQFEQVIALAANSPHQAWADKATVGLALVRAYLRETKTAAELANSIAQKFTDGPDDEHGRYAYFLQLLGQTYSTLGEQKQGDELTKAQRLYERAIASAEAGHYIQVKAKALTGMAVLQRLNGNDAGAIALHTQAVDLCKTIGATCDLAEAYFQLGLSLKQQALHTPPINSTRSSTDISSTTISQQTCFDQATTLLKSIRAPHQIKRVAQASAQPAHSKLRQ
ncbi:MAG: NB-ARC domain-containing protein [Cyanobacteria bacterium J06649_5]